MNGRTEGWRWLQWSVVVAAVAICSLRFSYLTADFPNSSPWFIDQAKYTDEGWWASGAVTHHLLGRWTMLGDYNPGVAVPVFPLLLAVLFHFTGVSIVAARALEVFAALATLGALYLLVRRYASEMAAAVTILLLAASPFAYVFSRLAILDTLVVLEFCLLLLVASYASRERLLPLAMLAVLIPAAVLTKTTAMFLVPAVFWLAWNAMQGRKRDRLIALALVGLAAGGLLRAYVFLVRWRGHAADYKYFFSINSPDPIVWRQSWSTISEIVRDGMWIDIIVYPLGLVVLILAIVWLRGLWRNPLFTACWIALAGQAAFLFVRQSDFPPRYYLVMLVPFLVIVVLAAEELRTHQRMMYWLLASALTLSLVANLAEIHLIIHRRTYEFYDAATAIGRIVRADPAGNPMICGVSGGDISLMTGLPSISDVFGTQPLSEKLQVYRPGWYVAWNGMDPEMRDSFSQFRMEEVANYPAFDDRERDRLVLYRMEYVAK